MITVRPIPGQSPAELARALYDLAGTGGRHAVRSARGGFDVDEELARRYLNRLHDAPNLPPTVLPEPAPAPEDIPPTVDLPGHQPPPEPPPPVVPDPQPQRRTRSPARSRSDAV